MDIATHDDDNSDDGDSHSNEDNHSHEDRVFTLNWMNTPAAAATQTSDDDSNESISIQDLERIDNDVDNLHRHALGLYSRILPEIGALVPHPVSFANVVKRIAGHSSDAHDSKTSALSQDLSDILPSAQALVVAMAVATSRNHQSGLAEEELRECIDKCDRILELEKEKARLLEIIENKMVKLAPNVSSLIGPNLAAQLVGFAGGLTELANSPSSNVQLFGKSAVMARFSKPGLVGRSNMKNIGILHFSDIVQSASEEDRTKAVRVLAGKVVLAARLDMSKTFKDGSSGEKWKQEITGKIEKWREPGQGRLKKPLPVPDAEMKKRRGGKRARALKRRLGISDLGKELDKTKFGTGEDDEYGDSAMGKTFGMVGKGKLKIALDDRKLYRDGPPTKRLKGGRVYKPPSGV